MKTRVRFAPSPTGSFHVGSAKIALINYLFARKREGDFILRIEDTDKERSVKKYEENILENLSWLGLEYDEGPEKEGKFGPYRQSRRGETYKKYINKLMETEKAYPCFCSREELEKEREKAIEKGEAPKYSGKCRDLTPEERKKRIENGEKFVIRLKVKDEDKIEFEDMIRGKVTFELREIGDFVLAKDEKTPLYNLACAIDDHEMKITHVIRGEDHISNTPKQILIGRSLNFEELKYGHLPLILAPDKSKLSKRHGAVSVSEYREEGFLPESLINFLVLLGWSPGDNREFFTLDKLEREFSMKRCKKSGAVFNEKKLLHINTLHIKSTEIERLTSLCIPYLIRENLLNPRYESDQYPPAMGARGIKTSYESRDGRIFSFELLKKIIDEHKDRMKKLSEITEIADYFFKSIEIDIDLLRWKKMKNDELADSIDKSINILSNIKNWEKEEVEKALLEEANRYDDRGKFLWPLRAALSGKDESAGPFEIAYLLGPKEAIGRLKKAKKILL